MSEEQRVITPFEIGVCGALQVIGTAIAVLDVANREKVADAARAVIAALPADNSIAPNSSAHHLALESLILGLLPEQSRKSGD
ncbi:hypothetical protein [Pseudomonas syringae]|uniref:hypothetical protein n=1 Tax=Pseudomonas syringae TaxID=317 RepID=UPI001072523E|nr:hypothetical protein [Pseudomonas syringae]